MKFLVLLGITMGLEAILFLYVGARGVITRKPVLIGARWLLGIMMLAIAPAFLAPLIMGSVSHHSPLDGWFNGFNGLMPVLLMLCLFVMVLQLKGYMFYGVTEDSFRDALRYSLERLALPYEESLSKIHLPTVGVDLNAMVQTRMGAAQLQVKRHRDYPLLKQITGEMRGYFEGHSTDINMVTCAIHTALGCILLLMAIGITSIGSIVGLLDSKDPSPAWQVSGPAPAPRHSDNEPLSLVGTWTGRFGSRRSPALLAITSQRGSTFDGVLLERSKNGAYRVQVTGSVLSDDRVLVEETRVVHAGRVPWALGLDTGNLKSDGLSMLGVGSDTGGSVYAWSFKYRTTRVVIPVG